MVKEGKLGKIRKVIVEYPQGWLATKLEDDAEPNRLPGEQIHLKVVLAVVSVILVLTLRILLNTLLDFKLKNLLPILPPLLMAVFSMMTVMFFFVSITELKVYFTLHRFQLVKKIILTSAFMEKKAVLSGTRKSQTQCLLSGLMSQCKFTAQAWVI